MFNMIKAVLPATRGERMIKMLNVSISTIEYLIQDAKELYDQTGDEYFRGIMDAYKSLLLLA